MGQISIVNYATPAEKAKGLQHMPVIPSATLFVFSDILPGTTIHSKNVREPFDLAFLSATGEVLDLVTIVPQKAVRIAPPRSYFAVEAKEGELSRLGFEVGRMKRLDMLLPPMARPADLRGDEDQEETT